MAVRPTPDRLRESLFNILAARIPGCVFLDAYAGTGAVGIEALSRGARRVILFEKNSQAMAVVRENLALLGVREEATVVRGRAVALIPDYPADIAFVDPPYERTTEYEESLSACAEAGYPLVVAQHASQYALDDRYGVLRRYRVVRQGDNSLSFYSAEKQNLDVHDVGSGGTGSD